MASQNPSLDEARPLMSTPILEEGTSSGHLHPAMIARPLNPPTQGYRDEDWNERSWPMNEVLLWVIRPVAIVLAFADIMVQLNRDHLGGSDIDVTLVVVTFLVMFWNMFKLIPKKVIEKLLSALKDENGDDTEVSCTVGRWKMFCYGGDVEEGGGHDGNIQQQQHNHKLSLIKRIVRQGLVDLILASFFMLFDILVATERRQWWRDSPLAVTVLTSILVGFQYIMILLPHISSCGPFSVTLNYKRDEPYQYRIRLPRDEAAAQSSARGKEPVSVTT
ncbi:hypothetical protein PG994_005641 [Apiospora phragmitis]|uniref:Uncharacterized protein n=1 Tax=Apiospora phragmitis TaxID=2905665 RepID=A0ABR1VCT7_9PEZI